jgi:hypothetical protein
MSALLTSFYLARAIGAFEFPRSGRDAGVATLPLLKW